MRTNALITAFLGKYVSAKNYNAFVSQNGMEGNFQVNDAGNVLGLTGSLSSAEGATYEFKDTLYRVVLQKFHENGRKRRKWLKISKFSFFRPENDLK